MTIKVEVDLSDMYDEGEEMNFSEQIKSAIAWDVKQQILNDWKSKITDEFTKHVVAEIEKAKTNYVDEVLRELAVDAKIRKRYSSDKMISITDYIKEELERTHLSDSHIKDFIGNETRNEKDRLKKISTSFTSELKERYDLMFASQIVSKLNENGMLKDKVAKLILDK